MFNNSAMKFGERLEKALIHMNWGPKDLEKVTGVADSTISAVIRRASDRTNFAEKLIKGFPPERISHEWLRSEEGEMIPPEPPPKFLRVAEVAIPHHTGSEFSKDAEIIAKMIDMVPVSDLEGRALVFNAASSAILGAVQQWRSKGQA